MDVVKTPRILPGLPGVGSLPLQFSATGQGMHREGLVVEFGDDEEGGRWVGNFQPGCTRLSAVFTDEEGLKPPCSLAAKATG